MHILRLVLLGLTVFAALSLALAYLWQAPRPKTPSAADPTTGLLDEMTVTQDEIDAARRGIEERLAAAPEYADVLERMKALFPTEYEAFLARFSRLSAQAGEVGNADFLVAEAVRALRLSHGILAAKADAAILDHVFVLQRAMLEALAGEDPHLCVDFLYGGASRDFFRFSANHRALVATFAMAGIEAINDGQIKHIERRAPTPEDLQLLEASLRANGLQDPEIEAILDGKASDPPLDEARMCQAGQIYLDALGTLPEPARMRIYSLAVELMARS